MTMSLRRSALAAIAFAVLVAAPVGAQEQTDASFRFSGRISAGRWVTVRNINGKIDVKPATGDQIEVTAVKRWKRGDPRRVRIEVTRVGENDGDVLVCALWSENAECDESGYRSNNSGNNNNTGNVSVDFTIRLPRGVHVRAGSVNGSVSVTGATGEVKASSVNGGIIASSVGGPVSASTVNGSIDVKMGSAGNADLSYSTVNGSVVVQVPDGFNAEIDFTTVNGQLRSEFPMTISGRISQRHIRGTVGKGGRRLKLRTVNGNVSLRKAT